MMTVRKGSDRGRSHNEWLDSRHTFSFADYHDARSMGFGRLRVVNEDTIAAGQGFGKHPHRDMEILSYVLEGALEHGDSMGNGSVIRPGDVQVMSAGTGVVHSERNHSRSQPDELRLIASRDGREGSVTVHQDANLYTALLEPGGTIAVPLAAGRRAWVQVVRGEAVVNGQKLGAGDGAAVEGEASLALAGGDEPGEALVFDLA
jgi:hypothetical protein